MLNMKRSEKHTCENKIINADFFLKYFIANLIESIYDQKKKKEEERQPPESFFEQRKKCVITMKMFSNDFVSA